MYVYDRKRTDLFFAFAPAVVGYVVLLFPLSLIGLVVGIGFTGVVGLTTLVFAWIRLLRPGRPVAGLKWLRIGLGIGLLGSIFALVVFVKALIDRDGSDGIEFPVALINVGILATWFFRASFPGRSMGGAENWAAAYLVAFVLGLHAMICVAGVYGGLPERLKARQLAEVATLGDAARHAVEAFASAHEGRLPNDNREAGLPQPGTEGGRYVASLTIDHGSVRILFGKDPFSTLFDVDDGGRWFAFVPVRGDVPGHVVRWTCQDGEPFQANSCTKPPFGLPRVPGTGF